MTATTMFFNRLEKAEFHKTSKQKWSERMENCIRNDGWYLKKSRVRIVIAILNKEVTKFALVFFGRGRRNSFYITSRISVGNLATVVCVASIDAE